MTDFDASFLRTLSLEDAQDQDVDDDIMEIDYTFNNDEDSVLPVAPELQDDDGGDDGDDDDQYHHTSFVSSILSPTTLGANLAVRKPQLLLPAPETADEPANDDYEYEYSTSSYVPQVNNRHMSLYSSSSNINNFLARDDEYIYNSSRGDYDYSKSPSPFEARPFTIQPQTVIHHHHYYGDERSRGGLMKPDDERRQQELHQRPTHELQLQLQQQQLQLQQQQQQQQQLQLHKHQLQVSSPHERHVDVALPHPWESNIHPTDRIPYLIWSYLQLVINFGVSAYGIYIVYNIVGSIRQDIQFKISQQQAHILVEIESCRRSFYENNCQPELIVPVLEKPCLYWEKCMNQDPFGGGGNTSSISAEIIGMIINSLVEPLGLKFFMVMFMGAVVVFGCNFTFGYIRAKSYYGWTRTEHAGRGKA